MDNNYPLNLLKNEHDRMVDRLNVVNEEIDYLQKKLDAQLKEQKELDKNIIAIFDVLDTL